MLHLLLFCPGSGIRLLAEIQDKAGERKTRYDKIHSMSIQFNDTFSGRIDRNRNVVQTLFGRHLKNAEICDESP